MSRLTDWIDRLEADRQSRKDWKKANEIALLKAASARLLVLYGSGACFELEKLIEQFPEGWILPASRTIQKKVGGLKGLYSQLAEGGLFDDAELAPWTSDFIYGLKLGGAILWKGEKEGYRIRQLEAREPLVKDLEQMPLYCHLSSPSNRGRGETERRLTLFHAARMPVTDPYSPSAMAGFLASGRLLKRDGEEWLELKGFRLGSALLDLWTIPYETIYKGTDRILVSPFYGAVFSHIMPEHVSQWMHSFEKPACCPLLPAMSWEMALKGVAGEESGLPFTGALPYGSVRQVLGRKGYGVRTLRKVGLDEFGLTAVYPGLREVLLECFHNITQRRNITDQ